MDEGDTTEPGPGVVEEERSDALQADEGGASNNSDSNPRAEQVEGEAPDSSLIEAKSEETTYPLTEIRPSGGRPGLDLGELWEFREVVYFFLWRQLKVDYRQMALGPLWIVIRPTLSALLYTVIFGLLAQLDSDEIPYPLFTFTALVVWNFFVEAAKTSSGSLVGYRIVMEKVYFPRLALLLVSLASSLINFLVTFALLIPVMAVFGFYPGWEALTAPLCVGIAGLFGLTVGVWAAPLVVHYRDVNLGLDYLLLAWMYATPIVYSTKAIPGQWLWLYELNPMVPVIQGFRWSMLGVGTAPGLNLLYSAAVSLSLLYVGLLRFRRAERSIVDIA